MPNEVQTWEVWVYGLISVTIISVFSLSGAIVIPCLKASHRNRWMHLFIALAVATLCCDALLHLIPEALGIHGHGHGEEEHHNETNETTIEMAHVDESEVNPKDYLWKMCVVALTVYMCYTVEFVSKWAFGNHGHSHNSSQVVPDKQKIGVIKFPIENGKENIKLNYINTNGDVDSNTTSVSNHDPIDTFSEQEEICLGIKPVAWLILLGDAVHNFADGMAIGATFTSSVGSGVKTSIAVACHELPHEIGDFVVLLDSGLSIKRALIFNVIGSVAAYAGFAIGLLLGNDESVRRWVFAAAAGVFLYVAWIDMLHHLKEIDQDHDHWLVKILLQNVGFLIGFAVIFVLGYYEDQIMVD